MEYGRTIRIQATVYASSQNDIVVNWYHEGNVVNQPEENDQVSVTTESVHVYVLSIFGVDSSHLGQYEVVVTLGTTNTSDTVQLSLPGKDMVCRFTCYKIYTCKSEC